jgi:hypothetical protein
MAARPVYVDPEIGLPDLVKQLTNDSKRLVKDEVHLAKLEAKDSVKTAGKGALWLGVAFGVGIVMLIALTIAIAAGIGEIANGNMWGWRGSQGSASDGVAREPVLVEWK